MQGLVLEEEDMKYESSSIACHTSRWSRFRLWTVLLLTVSAVTWGEEGTRRQTTPSRTPRSTQVKVVQLPAPATSSGISFERALSLAQNLEAPSDQKLTLAEIGQLAWAAQGVMAPQTTDATTTAGNLIPVKVYFSMPDGIYLYDPLNHALQQTSEQDARGAVATAVFSQQANASVPATTTGGCQMIITGSVRDFSPIYGQRARSVMSLLTGQMSQNVQLQAVSLDLTYIASGNVDGSAIKRALRLPRATDPMYVALIGYPASRAAAAAQQQQQQVGKRAVLIVPPSGFQDQELSETIRTLGLASVQTVIASTRAGRLVGSFGSFAQADLPLNQVKVEDFDAFVFIGGLGTIEYYNNPLAVGLARQAVAQQKVVAASSTAPVILANAGVLRGVQATSLPIERNQLIVAGAIFTGAAVQRDGRIITSTGPLVVPLFASTIVEALAGN
jgi:protease I